MKLNKNIFGCIVGLFLTVMTAIGQVFLPNADIGGFAGVSYYIGDINPRGQFYNPGLSLGLLAKYNFTEFHSLRLNAFFGELKGDDLHFNNEFQQTRAHSFETTLLDCHVGYELNFVPYIINRRSPAHSTYMFAAAGFSVVLSSTTNTATNHFTIPFGFGYKYRFNQRVTVGGEWGWRKTFIDTIDGLYSPGNEDGATLTHNNDWYSFVGVFFTIKVFEKGYKCEGVKEPRTFK